MERLKTRSANESCSERSMMKFFGTLTTWEAVTIGNLDLEIMALHVSILGASDIVKEWQEPCQMSER